MTRFALSEGRVCERQEMRMKHDESAEFPGCSGDCDLGSHSRRGLKMSPGSVSRISTGKFKSASVYR
jgi:hypothetical protein